MLAGGPAQSPSRGASRSGAASGSLPASCVPSPDAAIIPREHPPSSSTTCTMMCGDCPVDRRGFRAACAPKPGTRCGSRPGGDSDGVPHIRSERAGCIDRDRESRRGNAGHEFDAFPGFAGIEPAPATTERQRGRRIAAARGQGLRAHRHHRGDTTFRRDGCPPTMDRPFPGSLPVEDCLRESIGTLIDWQTDDPEAVPRDIPEDLLTDLSLDRRRPVPKRDVPTQDNPLASRFRNTRLPGRVGHFSLADPAYGKGVFQRRIPSMSGPRNFGARQACQAEFEHFRT